MELDRQATSPIYTPSRNIFSELGIDVSQLMEEETFSFPTDNIKDFQNDTYIEILSCMLNEIIEQKPEDPVNFLIFDVLMFPFTDPHKPSQSTQRALTQPKDDLESSCNKNLANHLQSSSVQHGCSHCSVSPVNNMFSMSHFSNFNIRDDLCCCTYQLNLPLQRVSTDNTTDILTKFFSSNETVMVIVGDVDEFTGVNRSRPSSKSSVELEKSNLGDSGFFKQNLLNNSCLSCVGNGKTKLMTWLDFPGRAIHGRKVLRINSSNADSLIRILEEDYLSASLSERYSIGSNSPEEVFKPHSSNRRISLSRCRYSLSFEHPQQRIISSLSLNQNLPSTKTNEPFGSFHKNIPMKRLPSETKFLSQLDPTLTLIDSIEPPHFILHVLHQHGYFRTARAVKCSFCEAVYHNVAVHKTIIFTRNNVFFKFPLPCPIYVITRKCKSLLNENESTEKRNGGVSFSDIFSERSNLSISNQVSFSGVYTIQFKKTFLVENPEEKVILCSKIIKELEEQYRISQLGHGILGYSLSMDSSKSFRTTRYSRCFVEKIFAQYLVSFCIFPQFDLSQFPLLTKYIVILPRSDVYVLKFFISVKNELEKGIINKLSIGNILCLCVKAQQCLSIFNKVILAYDVLQLYLTNVCGGKKKSFMASPDSSNKNNITTAKEKCLIHFDPYNSTSSINISVNNVDIDVANSLKNYEYFLTNLDLQDIILDKIEISSLCKTEQYSLTIRNILDFRGNEIDASFLDLFYTGHFFSTSSSTTKEEGNLSHSSRETSSLTNLHNKSLPLLLTTEATTVGEIYTGKGEPADRQRMLRPRVLFCFLVCMVSEGCSAVIVVEKNKVYSQSSFAKPDIALDTNFSNSNRTELMNSKSFFWTFLTNDERSIVHASLLSQSSLCHESGFHKDYTPGEDDILALLLIDGSTVLISVNNVPRFAYITIDSLSNPKTTPVSSEIEKTNLKFSENKNVEKIKNTVNYRLDPNDDNIVILDETKSSETDELRKSPKDGKNNTLYTDLQASKTTVMGATRLVFEYNYPFESTLGSGLQDTFNITSMLHSTSFENFVFIINSDVLNAEPPLMCCISVSYIAAIGENTDIISVARHNFSEWVFNSEKIPHKTIIFQTEEDVTCISILRDYYLLAGLVDGRIQCFGIHENKLIHTYLFHEKAVSVIRPLCGKKNLPCSASTNKMSLGRAARRKSENLLCFITGSLDTTVSIFCIDDASQLKSLRSHFAPIVDICATNYETNGIIITCDSFGTVIASSINSDLQSGVSTVWSSMMYGINQLHMSLDGSWLLCSRQDGLPQAMPIAEWVRHGVAQFHIKPISTIYITRCESYIFTGGEDSVIFVWDLRKEIDHLLSFRKHSVGSSIVSISTNSDASKVISSDSMKFVQLWDRSCGTVIRTISRSGECLCKFLQFDYFIVRSARDFKIFSPENRLITRSTEVACDGEEGFSRGLIDFYFVNHEDYENCFSAPLKESKKKNSFESLDDLSDEGRQNESPSSGLFSCNNAFDMPSSPADDKNNQFFASLASRYFVGIVNNKNGQHCVNIYSLDNLNKPRFTLLSGEIDDEFESDEETVEHDDTITTFVFLPARCNTDKQDGTPIDGLDIYLKKKIDSTLLNGENKTSGNDKGSDDVAGNVKIFDPPPFTPTLFLAATGADDLSVIVWNWMRQIPLIKLLHTNFISSAIFFYPTSTSSFVSPTHCSYSGADLHFLRENDPSFKYVNEGPLALLLTAQESDSENGVTLRIFEIREKAQSYNRRCLMQRTGCSIGVRAMNATQLEIAQAGTAGRNNRSVKSISVRNSDGLICTSVSGQSDLLFWRWMPSETYKSSFGEIGNKDEEKDKSKNDQRCSKDGSEDEEDRCPMRSLTNTCTKKVSMELRPLRRVGSRL